MNADRGGEYDSTKISFYQSSTTKHAQHDTCHLGAIAFYPQLLTMSAADRKPLSVDTQS